MKKVLIISFLIFTILLNCFHISYAATEITEKALKQAFQNFISSSDNQENYDISVSNNTINISMENENYVLNYDLKNKPTFSLKIPIKKGISYENFEKQNSNLYLPMLGYIAVANIQGTTIEDANLYFTTSIFKAALDSFKDMDSSDQIIISTSESSTNSRNPNVIYVSEFGDRVMEYVNYMYKNKQTISDSSDINSYTLTIEKQNTTESSCDLVSTLTVNTNADFSKISTILDNDYPIRTITKETADYALVLKVGQKLKIETNAISFGQESQGDAELEIDSSNYEFTAKKAGVKKMFIKLNSEKKSLYITVEENSNNEVLKPVIVEIKIPEIAANNNPNTSTNTNKNNQIINIPTNTDKQQQAVNKVVSFISKLPQTGDGFSLKDGLYLLCITSFIALITIALKSIKYKNTDK